MTERRPIIAANWKMHKTHLEAIQAVQKLSYLLDTEDAERVEVVICPAFTALRSVQTLVDSDKLPYGLGAQNVYPEDKGAFTGEVSPPMLEGAARRLRDRGPLGAAPAVRRGRRAREPQGEGRPRARDEPHRLRGGDAGGARRRRHRIARSPSRSTAAFAGVDAEDATHAVVAYEPIWAIGTGRNAEPADAGRVVEHDPRHAGRCRTTARSRRPCASSTAAA